MISVSRSHCHIHEAGRLLDFERRQFANVNVCSYLHNNPMRSDLFSLVVWMQAIESASRKCIEAEKKASRRISKAR